MWTSQMCTSLSAPAVASSAAVRAEGDRPAEDPGGVDVYQLHDRERRATSQISASPPPARTRTLANEGEEGLGRAEGDIAGGAAVSDRPSGRPVATSQSVTPLPPAAASIFPSALMLTPTVPSRRQWVRRSDRDRTSQIVAMLLPITAASVCPSATEREVGDLAAGVQQGRATGSSVFASQEPDPFVVEADGDQPAVRAEPPRVGVRPSLRPLGRP